MIDRLIAALEAGEAAGGDKLGHRSASVLVMGTERYALWDIRIDDADDPLEMVCKQREAFERDLLPTILMLPKRNDPLGGLDYRNCDGSV